MKRMAFQQCGLKPLLLFGITFVALCLCIQRFGYTAASEKVALVTGGWGFIGSHLTGEWPLCLIYPASAL